MPYGHGVPRSHSSGSWVPAVPAAGTFPIIDTYLRPWVNNSCRMAMDDGLYLYRARIVSEKDVADGDSCRLNADLGMGVVREGLRVRFMAIDTPERKRATMEAALAARDRVVELCVDKDLLVRTVLDRRRNDKVGKFGRILGVLYVERGGRWTNVNRLLLREGHALVRTFGDPVPSWARGFPRHPSERR